jgi:hypothetical protein
VGRAKELGERLKEQAKQRQREAGDRGRQKQKGVQVNLPEPKLDAGQTRDKIGELFGVSGKSVDHARPPEISLATDPRLVEFARQLKEERDHVLFEEKPPGDDRDGQSDTGSTFTPLGSSEAAFAGTIHEQDVYSPSEIERARSLDLKCDLLSKLSDADLVRIIWEFPHQPLAPTPDTSTPLYEERDKLCRERESLVKNIARMLRTVLPAGGNLYKEINARLAQETGVWKKDATVAQLERHAALLGDWIRQLAQARARREAPGWALAWQSRR